MDTREKLELRFIRHEDEGLDIVRDLFCEYSTGLKENLCFQGFDEELENPLKKYGEPDGSLIVAYINDNAAGCIALQPLPQQEVCEMKRLYVRQAFRNLGVGDQLIRILLAEARKKGYKKMVLDTLERLQPAIKLYTRHGFVNTSAYYTNPLKGVVYMEKEL